MSKVIISNGFGKFHLAVAAAAVRALMVAGKWLGCLPGVRTYRIRWCIRYRGRRACNSRAGRYGPSPEKARG